MAIAMVKRIVPRLRSISAGTPSSTQGRTNEREITDIQDSVSAIESIYDLSGRPDRLTEFLEVQNMKPVQIVNEPGDLEEELLAMPSPFSHSYRLKDFSDELPLAERVDAFVQAETLSYERSQARKDLNVLI